MRLDFFVKLKYQPNTITLSVGIKYSMRDLLCDVIIRLTRKASTCVTYGK